MTKNTNIPAVIVLIAYPVLLIILGGYFAVNYSVGAFEWSLLIGGYYISHISVCVGLHRLWSHDCFKTTKFVEFILMMLTAGTLQGPVLSWASNHFKHHSFTDKEEDPHTALKYGGGIKGFLWSHIGWMLVGEGSNKSIDKVTMVKLGRNKLLRFQYKYYWQLALFMNIVLPAIVGYLLGGTLFYAYVGFLFIGLGRALQQQGTFCVNSLVHFLGKKTYGKGTAGDVWWLAPFLLGENWHSYHHAFPSDYRNGVKWYQMDVNKWIIYAMSKVGLAWDLKRTTEVRIRAKAQDVKMHVIDTRKQELDALQEKANWLIESVYSKLEELESSGAAVKAQVKAQALKSFEDIQKSLKSLIEQLQSSMPDAHSSEKLLRAASAKLYNAERSIKNLYARLESSTAFS